MKDWLKVWVPAVLIVIAGFFIAYRFVGPPPPNTIRIAAGSPGGAYHRSALVYRELLKEAGISLEIVETAGSMENIELLAADDATVDVGFVQGGLSVPESLEAMGSLFLEPVFLFHRVESPLESIPDLAGRRVAVGAEGSGTKALAEQLLASNGLEGDAVTRVSVDSADSAEMLRAGTVDAMFFVGSPSIPLVAELLATDGIDVFSTRRAPAYRSRYRYLSAPVLPEGSLDLRENIPSRDIALVAPAALLFCREDFHPDLAGLLMQVIDRAHRRGGILEEPGEFPSRRYVEFELNREADRFFDYGPPLLQRFLPFWAANLIDRLKVMIIPLLTLLFPLFKIVPPIFRWRIRSKIHKKYAELMDIEERLGGDCTPEAAAAIVRELDAMDRETSELEVPVSWRNNAFFLREHIRLVRDRAAARAGGAISS